MLNALIQALKSKELRKRIYFTLFAFLIFKIMTYIPVPLTDPEVVKNLETVTLFGFADALSGGALKRFSIVALGVSPYITASIVIQLLEMDIIPVLAEWSKEGETGRQKINQVTRYTSLALAFIQSLAMAIGFDKYYGGALLIPVNVTPFMWVYIALVMTAGTGATLWLADQITIKGVGNGTSMIIMAGIVASFPYMINDLVTKYIIGFDSSGNVNKGIKNWVMVTDPKQLIIFILVILVMIVIIIAVIFMQNATRKIPIHYANRPGTLAGQKDSHLPIKLNPSGVIPVIFASSLLSLPLTIASFLPAGSKWASTLNTIFNYNQPIGFILYIVLIYLFSFFYAFVQISPEKVAENLKKQASYIPSVRPGKETENYISGVLIRTTVIGSTYLMLVAIIPILFTMFTTIPRSVEIGGTSLLIVVGVAQELFAQIEAKTKQQRYSGFIK
ncbi:MAG: preprotein translocase subunit SecY [Bacilli bacterium]|nr:preprotein translocase subunit SecY [Bacilli bacterium]